MRNACNPSLSGRRWSSRVSRMVLFTLFLSLFGLLSAEEEAKAAKVIRSIRDDPTGGDCTLVGAWNAGTRTCTLAADTTDLISIDSDNITLDGAGFTMTGTNTGLDRYEKGAGIAVNIAGRTGVTVRDLTIIRFDYGIDLVYTSNSTITGVTATNNAWAGISLTGARGNIITGNVISNNSIDTGICIGYASGNNEVSGNQVSTTERGIYLHTTCTYNNISNNTLTGHVNALNFMEGDAYNQAEGNTISGNDVAVYSRNGSNGNVMAGNTVENNGSGFLIEDVEDNIVAGNTISGNGVQARVTGGAGNSFNRAMSDGGGNHWSDYDSPVEGCVDAGGDGFCDAAYQFEGGVDNLPLADPATQSTGGDCEQPLLRLAPPNPYWASYNDYLTRRLSSNMEIQNYGTTNAWNVNIVVTLNTNGVVALTRFPVALGAVPATTKKSFTMQYQVPNGVEMFRSTLYTSATVGCDTVYTYPDSVPVV